MTSRIEVTCPKCNAKLGVSGESAGKRLKCPKCQATVPVPMQVADGLEDVVPSTEGAALWKVMVGTKKAGPFSKAKLRQLVDADKLPAHAFVRDEAETTDWFEVTTCDWLFVPSPKSVE